MSLYTTGFYVRRAIVGFLIFIGILVTIGLIGTITGNLTKSLKQTTPEPSSQGFGTITPAKIKASAQANLYIPGTITLDTTNGNFPDFKSTFGASTDSSALVNVYQIDIPAIQGDSRQRGIDLAENLGFKSSPKITDKDIHYEWTDGKRNLLYNVDTKTFEMFTSNISTLDTPATSQTNLDAGNSFAKTFLQNAKFNVNENLSYFKADYVKYDYTNTNWDIVPNATGTDKNANFIRVSYMRYTRAKGKDTLPSNIDTTTPDPTIVKEYYPGYYYSTMYMVVKNTTDIKASDIIEMSFYKYDYDITRPQTYKAKTPLEAFTELKSGNGTLVAITDENKAPIANDVLSRLKSSLKIKDVQIGYYLSGTKTGYALPVYVFTGDFVISTDGLKQKVGKAVYYVYAFKNS